MKFITSILALAAVAAAQTTGSASITPHDSYSSSIGVLGCMVDTNLVAYWPSAPTYDNMCVKVTANGRSVNLLHIDQSGGAYDISYNAWNYLSTGKSAVEKPAMGGGIDATYEYVDMSECKGNIWSPDGKLPLMAANSMNFVANSLDNLSKYGLWNIADSGCLYGKDEECTLDLSVSNQPKCPSQLGIQTPLTGMAVMNIEYGTGKQVPATI